jgi:hypothetical protein
MIHERERPAQSSAALGHRADAEVLMGVAPADTAERPAAVS